MSKKFLTWQICNLTPYYLQYLETSFPLSSFLLSFLVNFIYTHSSCHTSILKNCNACFVLYFFSNILYFYSSFQTFHTNTHTFFFAFELPPNLPTSIIPSDLITYIRVVLPSVQTCILPFIFTYTLSTILLPYFHYFIELWFFLSNHPSFLPY